MNNSSREAFVSVTVGFSQATTPLLGSAPGTTKPDGTPADGSAVSLGDAGLFAALLAMLTPGAATDPEAATATPDVPAAAAAPATFAQPDPPATATATELPKLPEPTDLQRSDQGKVLLKDFAAALKAARAAIDEGKPLDPALERKLEAAVAAIAAWFAGQPLPLPPPTVDTGKLSELASASPILPGAPSGKLPELPPPAPVDAAETSPPAPAAPSGGEPPPAYMQAKIVPVRLAQLGDALQDFATRLENTSPKLAMALAALADRISVGDISDDAMARLGLTRSPGSTSSELDQLVAALSARPDAKPATAPQSPIATPVLGLPEVLATATAKSDTKKPDVPQAEAVPPEAKADEPAEAGPLRRDAEIDTDLQLDARPAKPDDKPATAPKPAPDTAHAGKPDSSPAPPVPVTSADASAQVAQAAAANAASATRAVHAAYATPVQQLNLPQVAFEVVRQFEAGNSRFQIRLDPPELGRIDVRLDLDKHGTVNARLFVERPETLDLMLRDQRALQQALQQAGLDTSKTNLEFSLRQNPYTGADAGQGGGNGSQPGFGPFGAPAPDDSAEPAAQTLYRGSASASGLNLFV
jgi:flagellar hook-length control protein FliK